MSDVAPIGAKIRGLRRRGNLTQVQLAGRLGISPSYLNLIEQNRRPLSAALLLKLADLFQLDLKTFSSDHEARLVSDLLEVFGDSLFEDHDITAQEVRELASVSPAMARGVLTLYRGYRAARESADTIASRLEGADIASIDARLPTEEVSDLVQGQMNYFPELETGAEKLWRDARLESDALYEGLVRYLEAQHGVQVRIEKAVAMHGAVRRFDATRRTLSLSEVLRRGSRNFQIAYQVGLLSQAGELARLTDDPMLTTDESRALARMALANYFAAAVLMPYRSFLEAAQAERYDLDLLGHRFRANFEQTCHRLTTLRRPGAEGVPFHMVRIDIAGNISKRFSASGLRFARFSGACPRWNVFAAFLTPGMIRTQVSQMPDGATYFWVARTIRKAAGGYHAPRTLFAIGLGCAVGHAGELVYADGIDLGNRAAVVPVGITCRLCERIDCDQRAFPSIHKPLRIDEHVRGLSFYAPTAPGR